MSIDRRSMDYALGSAVYRSSQDIVARSDIVIVDLLSAPSYRTYLAMVHVIIYLRYSCQMNYTVVRVLEETVDTA